MLFHTIEMKNDPDQSVIKLIFLFKPVFEVTDHEFELRI